jgi:GPH family glycoside/pentoside/hexuronide:cation symporter
MRLSRTRLIAYSAPSLVTSVAALPMALFIPAFYSGDLGVPLASVGVAIALSRLLDVVTDPLIGSLSDRLRIPGGRRKPWMILGAPLFLFSLWKIFVPGPEVTAAYLLFWSAVLYLGFTLIDLPHKAWGAEISTDYDERTRITSWREAIATAGQVALLAGLVWLVANGVEAAASQLRLIALIVVIILPVLLGFCVFFVPERPPEIYVHAKRSVWAGLGIVARNPAFLRMIGCVLLFVSGVAVQGTLHRLVLADVMLDENRFPLMILLENLGTLAAVPIWLALSVRLGKHRALMAAALWLAVWSLPLIFMRAGEVNWMTVVIVIRGSSFASILFIANSIAADVIDVDTLESGEQRSGLFFAVWGMAIKLSLALGVVLATVLPSLAGYSPSDSPPTPIIQGRLMMIYGALPAVLMAFGALFLFRFPITKARHDEVRAELDALAEQPNGALGQGFR